jgi:hypothetical protein
MRRQFCGRRGGSAAGQTADAWLWPQIHGLSGMGGASAGYLADGIKRLAHLQRRAMLIA